MALRRDPLFELCRWWAEATNSRIEDAVPAKARELWYATATDRQLEELAELGIDPHDGAEVKTGDPWFDDFGK